ncbi:hypothetical protein GCM10020000_49510 [Streptomyces olivoverticillatus]
MRDARAEVEGLAGVEDHVVEEHGGDDAGVAGVVPGDGGVGGVRLVVRALFCGEALGGRRGRRHRVGHRGAVGGEDGREDLAQGVRFGLGVQQVGVRLEGVDAEGGEQFGRDGGGRGSRRSPRRW